MGPHGLRCWRQTSLAKAWPEWQREREGSSSAAGQLLGGLCVALGDTAPEHARGRQKAFAIKGIWEDIRALPAAEAVISAQCL